MKTGGRIDRELFYHLFYVTKERKKNMYQAANDRYEKMAYVRCGKSGLKLPAISLGLWHNFGDTGVYENMKQIYPNISLGTVYRNLSLLADLGEIQKLSSFGGADRFDARTAPHCHFMCTRCGRVMDVFSEHIDKSLESIAADFKDGQISDYKARFFGICKECLKEESH